MEQILARSVLKDRHQNVKGKLNSQINPFGFFFPDIRRRFPSRIRLAAWDRPFLAITKHRHALWQNVPVFSSCHNDKRQLPEPLPFASNFARQCDIALLAGCYRRNNSPVIGQTRQVISHRIHIVLAELGNRLDHIGIGIAAHPRPDQIHFANQIAVVLGSNCRVGFFLTAFPVLAVAGITFVGQNSFLPSSDKSSGPLPFSRYDVSVDR